MTDELNVERRGRVLVVTLDRQQRMNALSQRIQTTLRETWTSLRTDRTIRAIVITAAGRRAFCTGMDLQDFAERGGPREINPDVHAELRQTPLECDVWLPTIVAVNGVCTGAGFHFVADADVVVASTDAWFVDTHVSVGQVAAIEPITLLPRIGLGNALRLAVLGRKGRIDAAEALRISLVDEVVEPDRLLERALELADIAASGSPAAIEASKRAIRSAVERPMAQAMQYGWDLLIEHRAHPDCNEGPLAFVERREARWQ
ncbi:enoyl-CoA hydratase/isomerase family protein [Frankia sp. AgB1.9]|uniref:enoyl-CoA hydratase/isomerase family protein n=1 Tax=unclassified Frankia TaxID=2632575 RepID=UPI001931E659|nr:MULTISPECIES: enoyl-CoA hydratase/isomerase family protein [unclassified Frankia]MBL7494122.1 enoyl-CoA hydratase/isomerase family protein [Frankia sp. AgW1.1]MBL7551097.1 enoyl-CoA hydratase/isomerase family protein [Frankia sp. AgB1.9]MBL7624737.1 enoyl-CoA hydratase/isomerase family protein [Frankia sp. AgB1.8]